MNKFPKLDHGSCDGLGCGWVGMECFCNEYLWMREEYQRQYDKIWDSSTDECKVWEKCWRENWKRYIEDPAEKREVAERIERDARYKKSTEERMERIAALEKEADENSIVKMGFNTCGVLKTRCKYKKNTMVGSIYCASECENFIEKDDYSVKCLLKRREFIEERHLARLAADKKRLEDRRNKRKV